MNIVIHTKSQDTVDTRIREIAIQDAVGTLLSTMSPLQIMHFATMLKSIEDFAKKSGATIKTEGTNICLEKEIGGKVWPILTIDHDKKVINVVVDVKQFRKPSIPTGLTSNGVQISGYTVRQIHEVRGPLAWLLNTDIKGREIITRQGEKVFVEMVLEERQLKNGDIVRYNTCLLYTSDAADE